MISGNLFHILNIISTAGSITNRMHICEFRIYSRMIIIKICVGNSLYGDGGGQYEDIKQRKGDTYYHVISSLSINIFFN